MTIAKSGPLGIQPAKALIAPRSQFVTIDSRCSQGPGKSRVPEVAAALSELIGREVKPRTLRSYLDGFSCPPAEVRYGLVELLGRNLSECWTREVCDSIYTGPRSRC